MPSDLTQLLQDAGAGDSRALEAALPIVYDELRRLAAAQVRRLPAGQTLQPTALVHEAYLRLVRRDGLPWESRRHFFFAAARAMRDILIDEARRKHAKKRGGDRRRMSIDALEVAVETPAEDLLALNDALGELEATDETGAQLVLLKCFLGLPHGEVAELMGIPARTLDRKWRFIRAWLGQRLAP